MNLKELEDGFNLLKRKVQRIEGVLASKVDPEILKTIEKEDRVLPPESPRDNQ